MKKNKKIQKMTISKETLAHLQPESLELRKAGGYSGPSCDIYRYCTMALDCAGSETTC